MRRGAPPPQEEEGEEQEAPAPGAPGRRGAGRAPAPSAAAPAADAKKKKLILVGGGAAAAVLLIGIALVVALKGPGRPENAGLASECKELWKLVETDIRQAENKDENDKRVALLRTVAEKIEGQRALHDYGWVDYIQGFCHLRAGKIDEAKASLEAAIQKLPEKNKNYPKILRGLISARAGQERLLTTRRFRAGGPSAAPDPEVEAMNKAAMDDLKLAEKTKAEDFLSGAWMALADAEANRIDGRGNTAQNKYESAINGKADPGYAGAMNGSLYYDVNKFDLGMKSTEAALLADRGSAFCRLSHAWGLRKRALADIANKDAPAWLDAALEQAVKAKEAGHPAGAIAVAAVTLDKLILKMERGEDARGSLAEAESKSGEADANEPAAAEIKAMVLARKGELEEREGRDPRGTYDAAIGALDRIAGDGSDTAAVMNRARVLMKRARAEAAKEGDPRALYDRAFRDYTAAKGKDAPGGGTTEPTLGAATAMVEKGIEDSKRGTDATAVFERVVGEMTAILRSNSTEIAALEARGLARWALGEALVRAGKDGQEAIDKALDDLAELFRLRPSQRVGTVLVDAWLAKAAAAEKAGFDARAGYEGAARALDEILRTLAPGSQPLLLKRGMANVKGGEYEVGQLKTNPNMDPRPKLVAATNDFGEILKVQPDHQEALWLRGHALWLLGQADLRKNQDARVSFNRAVVDFDKLLQLNPKHYKAAFERADAILWNGQIEESRNIEVFETFTRAVAGFEQALAIDDKSGEAWNGVGNCWLMFAEGSRKRQKEMGPALDKAEAAYRKALTLGHKNSKINLGVVLGYSKRYDEAKTMLDEAETECPDQKDRVLERKNWLEDIKKRVAGAGQ
jgi:tetratricopeptide (TPR) repeat protein